MSTNDGRDLDLLLTADDVLDDVRSTVRTMVRGGFLTFDEVLSRALELVALADEVPSPGSVERAVRQEWDARLAELGSRPGDPRRHRSDDARLDAAFADLTAGGILARACLGDCEECGVREARALARPGQGWVFFPESAVEGLTSGMLRLACGVPRGGDLTTLVRDVVVSLAGHGLRAEADGDHVVVHVREWRRGLPRAA